MSLPEISRRCLSCGASVRAGARFCPQCGSLMEAQGAEPTTPEASGPELLDTEVLKETFSLWESGAHPRAAETREPSLRLRDDGRAADASNGAKPSAALPDERPATSAGHAPPPLEKSSADGSKPPAASALPVAAPEAASASAAHVPPPTASALPASAPPERGRRRAVAAVEERIGPRVEKLREASMGVLEEASEDTGLRFVLVAIVLFVLALVILLVHSALK
ncbi:MAG TPA: zinc-ribbon domain-containing protein [Pyrinomonadaceae bacterium]|nr:zinc-ribbon domain-containing protein [Pyrinomonadaceae bacterium]